MSADAESSNDTADSDDPNAIERVYRTVKPTWVGHSDREMSTIGWGIFLGLLVLLVPLLPFILLAWVLGRILERVGNRLRPGV